MGYIITILCLNVLLSSAVHTQPGTIITVKGDDVELSGEGRLNLESRAEINKLIGAVYDYCYYYNTCNGNISVPEDAKKIVDSCIPCDCADGCFLWTNCCRDYQLNSLPDLDITQVQGLICNSIPKLGGDVTEAYMMRPICALGYQGLAADECLQHSRTGLHGRSLLDIIPVFSNISGKHYPSVACAQCNQDDDWLITWKASLYCKSPAFRYFHLGSLILETVESAKFILDRNYCNIEFIPPVPAIRCNMQIPTEFENSIYRSLKDKIPRGVKYIQTLEHNILCNGLLLSDSFCKDGVITGGLFEAYIDWQAYIFPKLVNQSTSGTHEQTEERAQICTRSLEPSLEHPSLEKHNDISPGTHEGHDHSHGLLLPDWLSPSTTESSLSDGLNSWTGGFQLHSRARGPPEEEDFLLGSTPEHSPHADALVENLQSKEESEEVCYSLTCPPGQFSPPPTNSNCMNIMHSVKGICLEYRLKVSFQRNSRVDEERVISGIVADFPKSVGDEGAILTVPIVLSWHETNETITYRIRIDGIVVELINLESVYKSFREFMEKPLPSLGVFAEYDQEDIKYVPMPLGLVDFASFVSSYRPDCGKIIAMSELQFCHAIEFAPDEYEFHGDTVVTTDGRSYQPHEYIIKTNVSDTDYALVHVCLSSFHKKTETWHSMPNSGTVFSTYLCSVKLIFVWVSFNTFFSTRLECFSDYRWLNIACCLCVFIVFVNLWKCLKMGLTRSLPYSK